MITAVFSVVLIALGAAIIARTVLEGVDGGLGLLLGTLFVLGGVARLYLHRRVGRG